MRYGVQSRSRPSGAPIPSCCSDMCRRSSTMGPILGSPLRLPSVPSPVLRPANAGDVDAVSEIFHQGWHDVHPGLVPDGLTERRTPEAFRDRVSTRISETDETTVAEVDGVVAGFIMVSDDEAEQV